MTQIYGHIKLSRKLFDADPWWVERRTFSRFEAWVDMLQLAAWRPVSVTYQGILIGLERGELLLSVRKAADRWGWSPKMARTFLKQAQSGARVRAQRETHGGTVYLIVNYDTYQSGKVIEGAGEGTPKGKPKGTARAQRGHSAGTARAQEEAVKQGNREAVDLSESPDGDPPAKETWLTPYHDLWTRRVGIISPKRCATAIAPVRAQYGDAATLKGLEAYLDEPRNPDKPIKLEYFKTDAARWIREGAIPLHVDGILTTRGERVTRPA